MKLKIFLMPLTIAFSIILVIWYVYPLYSNGVNGVSEERAQLKVAEKRYADANTKQKNTETMAGDIADKKDELESFIPKEIREQTIVDNLNYKATSSNLFVTSLDFKDAADVSDSTFGANPAAAMAPAPAPVATAAPDPNAPGITDPSLLPAPLPLPLPTRVEMVIVGSYPNIKKFVSDLEQLQWGVILNGVEIKANPQDSSGSSTVNTASADSTGSADSAAVVNNSGSWDSLVASLKFDFITLSEATVSDASISDPVFQTGNLDTAVIDNINSARSSSLMQLNIDQKGKEDIFKP